MSYNILASGKYSHPVVADGRTVYYTGINYDPHSSRVTLWLPDGEMVTLTNTDPTIGISKNWGNRAFEQIIHPKTTDGDVQFIGFKAN